MYRFNKDKKKKDYSRLIDLIIGFLRENDHRPLKNYIKRPQFVIEIFLRLFQAEKKNWRYRQSDRTPDVNYTSVNSVGISTKSNKKNLRYHRHTDCYIQFHRETVALRRYLPLSWIEENDRWSMKKKKKIKGKNRKREFIYTPVYKG